MSVDVRNQRVTGLVNYSQIGEYVTDMELTIDMVDFSACVLRIWRYGHESGMVDLTIHLGRDERIALAHFLMPTDI
jgi:hypothetical protein